MNGPEVSYSYVMEVWILQTLSKFVASMRQFGRVDTPTDNIGTVLDAKKKKHPDTAHLRPICGTSLEMPYAHVNIVP